MAFIENAEAVARNALNGVDPTLEDKFAIIVRFLTLNPESAAKLRGKNAYAVGTKEYVLTIAKHFAQARGPRRPEPPTTVPDEMVSFVLQHYFDVPAGSLAQIKKEHALSMAAENIVGNLLERYVAETMEPLGWVWCSGSPIKAVDFIKPPEGENKNWHVLQVKNRDNSENSSSSAIRAGTTINKWYRTFSKKNGTNWAAFPHVITHTDLSEKGFQAFAKNYLEQLRRFSDSQKL